MKYCNDSARFRIFHVHCNSGIAITPLVSIQILSYYLNYTTAFYNLIVIIRTITFNKKFLYFIHTIIDNKYSLFSYRTLAQWNF